LALGLLVFNDKISIFRQTGAYFAYAFRVQAGPGKLSFGMQGGFDVHREDATHVFLLDPRKDPLFEPEVHNTFMPNVGVGTYYYTPNFFAGLSLPQFLKYSPNTADSYKGKPAFSNIMLFGGLIVPINSKFKLKPSALMQHAGDDFLFDLNCNALFREMFELGASWRSNNTLVGMMQFRFQSFCIGYAYDFPIGKPNAINTSHEIMLRYDFKIIVKALNPLHLSK